MVPSCDPGELGELVLLRSGELIGEVGRRLRFLGCDELSTGGFVCAADLAGEDAESP